MFVEKKAGAYSGWAMLALLLVAMVLLIAAFISATKGKEPWLVILWLLAMMLDAFLLTGFIIVNPNEGKVVLLFGTYLGTIRDAGFWWMNPLTTKRRVSLRVRNFETPKLKVNDHDGNPIEIAAVVVWQVVDTAEAIFQVDDYENFVHVQSEAALRNLATSYPYDAHQEGQMSLRGNTVEIAKELKREIQERLAKAGVEVIESRISHLAYAP